MTLALSLADALASPLVDQRIPVATDSLSADTIRHARWAVQGTQWEEIEQPLSSQGGCCRYGCKLYARRWGAALRFAVVHLSAYGHPRPERQKCEHGMPVLDRCWRCLNDASR